MLGAICFVAVRVARATRHYVMTTGRYSHLQTSVETCSSYLVIISITLILRYLYYWLPAGQLSENIQP